MARSKRVLLCHFDGRRVLRCQLRDVVPKQIREQRRASPVQVLGTWYLPCGESWIYLIYALDPALDPRAGPPQMIYSWGNGPQMIYSWGRGRSPGCLIRVYVDS